MTYFQSRSVDEAISKITAIAGQQLMRAISGKGSALLALSGGSTPEKYLPALFTQTLDWPHVQIVLVDERWVDPQHPDSNEGLIERLRANTPAVHAPLFSLWSCGDTPEIAAADASRHAERAGWSVDVGLLGMGGDGHIASLFPNDPAVSDNRRFWIDVETPAPPNAAYPRISLSSAELLLAHHLLLVFSGQDKLKIWSHIRQDDTSPLQFPAALLKQHNALDVIAIDLQA